MDRPYHRTQYSPRFSALSPVQLCALSKLGTNVSTQIYYYRCSGSDAYRHGGKAICDQKPIRQDLLDQLVWDEILRLLEDPMLIQNELNRRLETARESSPTSVDWKR